MKTIYILNVCPTKSNYGIYYFLKDNCSSLSKEKLHYINYQYDGKIYRHTLIQRLLFSAGTNPKEKKALQALTDALLPFDKFIAKTDEDILIPLNIGQVVFQKILCETIHSKRLKNLSKYNIQFVYILQPQSRIFDALAYMHRKSLQERKADFMTAAWIRPFSLYKEAQNYSGLSPRVLLTDDSCSCNSTALLQSFDRSISSEALFPLKGTAIHDRHSFAFAHWLDAACLTKSAPTWRDITVSLADMAPQAWHDPLSWTPPQLLQEIDDICKDENTRLAQCVFNRQELFTDPVPYQQGNWHPYKGLKPEIRTRLMASLMEISSTIQSKLKDAVSCRWQYTLLPPEEKKLFPDPNSPQVLAEEPLVSVLTLTRNQASMIAENMESVLAQQTRFPFQHIIVDDGSGDDTPDIISEYAARHPRIIKPILLKHKAPDGENVRALFEQCRSRYAVLCDGDDYFTDPGKLQTQVDFMERNPDCALCFHPVSVVYADGSPTKIYPPADLLPGGERLWYTLRDLLISNFIQTNSVMYRWRFQAGLPEWFDPTLIPGDWYWHLLHAETGKIAYLRKPMSAYRRHAASLYALAEKDHVAHRHQHGMHELRTYNVCNAHFHNRYYKDFSRLARGVFADFVQDYLKTKDDGLLQEGIAAAPDFARDFLSLLASQNMHLPPSGE